MKVVPKAPLLDRRAIAGGLIFIWVAVSPWVWGFADAHSAVANHVVLVFGFGPLALLIANLRAAAIVTLLGGTWLVASPWVLGYASDNLAWLNELVSGGVLIVLCAQAAELGQLRRSRARRGTSSDSAPVVAETAGSPL
jgi:hypothetical protein